MKNLIILLYLYLIHNTSSKSNTSESNNDKTNSTDDIEYDLINPVFKKFTKEWTKKMSHVFIQYSYSIPIKYKQKVEYYENITQVPCVFQGAFLYDGAKTEKDVIDFRILSPNKTVLFQSSAVGSVFIINLKYKGLYTIEFNNRILNKEVRPVLLINSGQNLVLSKENITQTEKSLDSIIGFLNKYEQDSKLTRGFKRRSNEELSNTNTFFFIFSLIETFVLIGVSIWQYFYLKHLFEIKGSL